MRAIDHVVSTIVRNVDLSSQGLHRRLRRHRSRSDQPTSRPRLAATDHHLIRTLEVGEGVPFSPPKATVVADSSALACHIRTALGPRGGQPCNTDTVL